MHRETHTSAARLAVSTLALSGLVLGACKTGDPDYSLALNDGASALIPLEPGELMPDVAQDWDARADILPALDQSIAWTKRAHAAEFFPQAGITHERALASLERFREVLVSSYSADDFRRTVEREFTVYKSAGWDGYGSGVLFTAYCTPLLNGSIERTPGYDHPLYALPSDLIKAADGTTLGRKTASGQTSEYFSRGAIEAGNLLAGRELELVWLADPIDAYIAHVNGSAFVRLSDGTMYRLGYAGKNGRPYRSLGRALEDDGILKKGEASLAKIREWGTNASPEELHDYLSINQSYVFFTPIDGNPHGSLDVPVTPGRSVATDKTLFPRGAIVFVDADRAVAGDAPFGRFYFDQDTGGAIRTAGRADLYLGIGPEAEAIAGETKTEGQMYYLFLRDTDA
jgi:membrane-bound lytic murein transglycosylase A